jgi:anti-sigma B factor antagonist
MNDNNELIPGFDDEKDANIRILLQKIDEKCMVIYPTGYIDTYNSTSFQRRVEKAIEAGFNKLVFHLAGVNYISSTGIGVFLNFLKLVKPRGGDIILLEIQPKVYEVFQLLGFAQFFNIKENLDEAVTFFTSRAGDKQEASFPRIFRCPICSKRLRASKAGRFRCSECKTILGVHESGEVNLS